MESQLRKTLPKGVFNTTPQRSALMGKIRGGHNRSTEARLRYALVGSGVSGWTMHANLPGRPDFYFSKHRLAIFVDGCFWHGCPKCGHIPNSHSLFWRTKFERNRLRAARSDAKLRAMKISARHIRECDLRRDLSTVVAKLSKALLARKEIRKDVLEGHIAA